MPGLLHGRLTERKPVLQQVNAQHGFQWIRLATAASLRIVRFDQRHQARPGHNEIHLGKNALTAGLLAFAGVFEIGKLLWLMAFVDVAGLWGISAQVTGHVQT